MELGRVGGGDSAEEALLNVEVACVPALCLGGTLLSVALVP